MRLFAEKVMPKLRGINVDMRRLRNASLTRSEI